MKYLGIGILLLFIAACESSAEDTNNKALEKGWKSYEKDNFSISYPEKWRLDESGQQGTTLALFSPTDGIQDNFSENVNLLIQNLEGLNMDLKKYTALSVDQINTMFPGGEILENTTEKVGNKEYQKLKYKGTNGEFELMFEQFYFIKDNKAYILTLTCEADQFEKYKKDGEKIMKSFELK